MGTTYQIRENIYPQDNYFWQKNTEVDIDGNVYQLVIDCVDGGLEQWWMYLYKFNDAGGAYAEITHFRTQLSDTAKIETASMIFDAAKRYLYIAFTTKFDVTYSLYCGVFDPVHESWHIQPERINSSTSVIQAPDICLDQEDCPYIVYNTGAGGYYTVLAKINHMWCISIYHEFTADRNHSVIKCSNNNEIYLLLSVTHNLVAKSVFIMFPAGTINFDNSVFCSAADPVFDIDDILDAHIVGLRNNTTELAYYKYNHLENTWTMETVRAAGEFDDTGGWGICIRRDPILNTDFIFIFYADENQDIFYTDNTIDPHWSIDNAVNAVQANPVINLMGCKLPASAAAGLLVCKFIDTGGVTIIVSAWHSEDILEAPPSAGGYYPQGYIRPTGSIKGVNVDKFGWEDVSQILPIIAITTGVGNRGAAAGGIEGETGDVILFSDGNKIWQYDPNIYDDNGQPIAVSYREDGLDNGDPERNKTVEYIIPEFEGESMTVYLCNEKGFTRRIVFSRSDNGKKIGATFNYKILSVHVAESSEEDFKLNELIIQSYTTEM